MNLDLRTKQSWRDREARELRRIRKIMNEPINQPLVAPKAGESVEMWMICGICLMAILLVAGCQGTAQAQEYTDEQIVKAIYKAEGGQKAKYPYGIRSIKCEGEKACRKICLNTVRNNRVRFARTKGAPQEFISFLGHRYCPVGASNDPKGLNKNWQKNVRFFLAKARAK
jgi:hypothetical protein